MILVFSRLSVVQAQTQQPEDEYQQHKAQLAHLAIQPTDSQSLREALIRLLYEESVGYQHWNLHRTGRFADEICIEGKNTAIQVPEWVLILFVNELEDLQARVIYTLDASPLRVDWAILSKL
jgi:hypothetical protein